MTTDLEIKTHLYHFLPIQEMKMSAHQMLFLYGKFHKYVSLDLVRSPRP